MSEIGVVQNASRRAHFSKRGMVIVLTVLAVLAAATWGIGTWNRLRLSDELSNAQLASAQEALDLIEAEFREIQNSMVREARNLASDARVIRALRNLRTGSGDGEEEIIRMLAGYTLVENGAIEIYDQQPRLIGWAGSSIPIDPAPSEVNFLESYQSSLAFDGDRYSALVVWWPIRDGVESVGAVRIIRMIVRHVPVRNEYLRDYTLDEEWSRLTTLSVRVTLDPKGPFDPSESRFARTLRGADGRTLARAHVTPPSERRLLRDARNRYLDLLFLWFAIALGVILFAIGRWTVHLRVEPESPLRGVVRFSVFLAAVAAVRYGLLAMNIPGRWQQGKAPLSPLFDPQHLASGIGGGFMQTSGDLLVSALFAVLIAAVFVRATESVRRFVLLGWSKQDASTPDNLTADVTGHVSRNDHIRLFTAMALHVAIVLSLLMSFALVSQHAVLDSTLDFFERSGLLPDRLVLVVFASLLLITFSVAFLCARSLWVSLAVFRPSSWISISRQRMVFIPIIAAATVLAVAYQFTGIGESLRLDVVIVFLTAVYAVAYFSPMRTGRGADSLHLRSVVPSVVLVSLLLYPVLERGFEMDRRSRMQQATGSFEDEMDSRVLFAIGQILDRSNEITFDVEAQHEFSNEEIETTGRSIARYDSIARYLTHGELISSLGTHDISVTLFSLNGLPRGRYQESRRRGSRSVIDEADRTEFDLIRSMYVAQGDKETLIEKMTGDRERERFVYVGFAPILSNEDRVGWLLVRAAPNVIAREGAQAFPRVLIPSGYYGEHYANMSLAEFQDGVMVRNYGRSFGRYTLDAEIDERLRIEPVIWSTERIREREYMTLYRRLEESSTSNPAMAGRTRTIAVRLPEISFFDHLYYLLRVTIAGLFLGIPVYLIGIVWRFSTGLLPAKRVRFQDKVLNAFFAVGLVTVAVTGWVGLEVVTGENERAIESWLRQHLLRVEDTLAEDARSEELPYRVLERTDLDSLSNRVGLDLNIYRAADLERSSRPQLVRDRLIDTRLPIQAYEALYYDGFRFISVDESLGSFYYTAGYRALTDERGDPKYVISLPTLPEQERIEEERARTVAYLFGALLLLVLAVMVTAALLANALARPIARLREGLEAVSEGRFESIGPIASRDEISDLVDSFNTMQEQLSDSRELLAKQERQLAWREMARQVAHEIKNPLTPMKLSIQHLRTAFSRMKPTSSGVKEVDQAAFETKFTRTTTTLIDQINALARIADGFSSFGRMPQHIREPLDLNVEVEAAAGLMRNETDMEIETELAPGALSMEGDKEALRRLFINLIKNAIQAIPDDRQGIIRLSTSKFEDENGRFWSETSVSDNGTGIAEELWEKIFVPSFSTKTSGTGLGLAIAQKTIEDLEGEIGFTTTHGVGTTFRVRLPLTGD